MSVKNERDVRTVLVREKYFSLHPKPLERWLWQQGIPPAAERVFWVHWEEGMRRGDWCSEISLRQVARECAVDESTVTRAYQALRRLGLVRREDAGRDPNDPFKRCIAVTEVLIPRELLVNLARYPNRHRVESEAPAPAQKAAAATDTPPIALPKLRILTRDETKAIFQKLSESEHQAYFAASRDRRTVMNFDAATKLTPDERGRELDLLTSLSIATPSGVGVPPASVPPKQATYAKPRKLSALEAARVRSTVQKLTSAKECDELFRQVLWSIEEGALRRFDPRMALNIALKKIREGAWTKPNRLPPHWLTGARSDTCSAA
jgi:DNA-binding MarR family transcriptional regulator